VCAHRRSNAPERWRLLVNQSVSHASQMLPALAQLIIYSCSWYCNPQRLQISKHSTVPNQRWSSRACSTIRAIPMVALGQKVSASRLRLSTGTSHRSG
jgi:hypothetical protein